MFDITFVNNQFITFLNINILNTKISLYCILKNRCAELVEQPGDLDAKDRVSAYFPKNGLNVRLMKIDCYKPPHF